MRKPNLELKHFLSHSLIWLIFFCYEQFVFFLTESIHQSFQLVGPTYLLNVLLFYVNNNLLLPTIYNKGRYWVFYYSLATFVLLATYALLRCEIYLHLAPFFRISTVGPVYSYSNFWVLAFYRGTFFQFASMGYWFTSNALRGEQQKRAQERQLRITERNLMRANLAFLKNQINPHFLFNSLNFLYAQVYPHSENAANAVLLLADTMRYALQDDQHGKVMLVQEVKHLYNYIEINQLRFNNSLQVDFKITGNIQFLMITPLVLVTFVENCFKHGELDDPTYPLTIHMSLINNELIFTTRNKKRNGPKEKSTGIGLINTRHRLDIMYKDCYTLVINDGSDDYICTLNITL